MTGSNSEDIKKTVELNKRLSNVMLTSEFYTKGPVIGIPYLDCNSIERRANDNMSTSKDNNNILNDN